MQRSVREIFDTLEALAKRMPCWHTLGEDIMRSEDQFGQSRFTPKAALLRHYYLGNDPGQERLEKDAQHHASWGLVADLYQPQADEGGDWNHIDRCREVFVGAAIEIQYGGDGSCRRLLHRHAYPRSA